MSLDYVRPTCYYYAIQIKLGGNIFTSAHYWLHKAWLGVISGMLAVILLPVVSLTADSNYPTIGVWWPSPGAVMDGAQPLKAVLGNTPIDQYKMTWRVDNGNENAMYDSWDGSAHKQADVQLSGWTWKGAGPYTITFAAYNLSDNSRIATNSVTFARTEEAAAKIGLNQSAPATTAPASTPTAAATPSAKAQAPAASAKVAPVAHLSDNEVLSKIASIPQGYWLTGDDPVAKVNAAAGNSLTSVVVYDIPGRDCGSYSAGGAGSPEAYAQYIQRVANAIGGRSVRVILEPDAMSEGCVDTSLVAAAVHTLTAAGGRVYIDAGGSTWISASTMAQRLNGANISEAAGFSLNVSGFNPTAGEINYGTTISNATGGKHFVIDTSRNGNGTNGSWCNPSGRGLGSIPTMNTGYGLLDAMLWIKRPGESDGTCNGGPSAGVFWSWYALGLGRTAGW